jgi:hypothetical protein
MLLYNDRPRWRAVCALVTVLTVLCTAQAAGAQAAASAVYAVRSDDSLAHSAPQAEPGAEVRRAPPPRSGMGWIALGWLGVGSGTLLGAQLALCHAELNSWSPQRCVRIASVAGGVSLALGIPLLVLGYKQRAKYNAWRRGSLGRQLSRVGIEALPAGALLSYRASL